MSQSNLPVGSGLGWESVGSGEEGAEFLEPAEHAARLLYTYIDSIKGSGWNPSRSSDPGAAYSLAREFSETLGSMSEAFPDTTGAFLSDVLPGLAAVHAGIEVETNFRGYWGSGSEPDVEAGTRIIDGALRFAQTDPPTFRFADTPTEPLPEAHSQIVFRRPTTSEEHVVARVLRADPRFRETVDSLRNEAIQSLPKGMEDHKSLKKINGEIVRRFINSRRRRGTASSLPRTPEYAIALRDALAMDPETVAEIDNYLNRPGRIERIQENIGRIATKTRQRLEPIAETRELSAERNVSDHLNSEPKFARLLAEVYGYYISSQATNTLTPAKLRRDIVDRALSSETSLTGKDKKRTGRALRAALRYIPPVRIAELIARSRLEKFS
jgi:hypothetical protein